MKVEGVGMARVCRTCFIAHHDASRSQVDTRQHIGSGDSHGDSGASHVGPSRRTVLSEPLHARPQRSATHSSGMRVRNEQRRRSSSSGMFERGYICDDALLPTTRVTRRILPAVQWYMFRHCCVCLLHQGLPDVLNTNLQAYPQFRRRVEVGIMFPAWLCGCCVGNYVVVPVSTCCLCHSVAYGFAHTPPCGAVAGCCQRCMLAGCCGGAP